MKIFKLNCCFIKAFSHYCMCKSPAVTNVKLKTKEQKNLQNSNKERQPYPIFESSQP